MCMNQQDIEERGQPVWLMPQIYSRTHRVFVYVGRPVQEEVPSDSYKIPLISRCPSYRCSRR